ncbi:MAG: hypothetical protein ACRCZQ_02700 [Bacteroidales bacterium]
MKHFYLLILSLLYTTGWAQSDKSLDLSSPTVRLKNNTVAIEFQGWVGKKYTGKNYQMHLIPVLINRTDSVLLPEILVQGRLNRILQTRAVRAGEASLPVNTITIPKGSSFTYQTEIPYEDWMNGANLDLLVYKEGCCNTLFQKRHPILPQIALREKIEVTDTPEPVTVPAAPILKREKFVVEFKVSSIEMLPDFGNNRSELNRLKELLENQSRPGSDMKFDRIEIAGYASPEGPAKFNSWLAENRAQALMKFVNEYYPEVPRDKVVIVSGDIDWDGLMRLVSGSTMPESEKEQVLNLVKNHASDPAVNEKLKALNGGKTYMYIYKNIYPKLRYVYAVDCYWVEENNK